MTRTAQTAFAFAFVSNAFCCDECGVKDDLFHNEAYEVSVCADCDVTLEEAAEQVESKLGALRQRALSAFADTFTVDGLFADEAREIADAAEAALIAFAEAHNVEAWA